MTNRGKGCLLILVFTILFWGIMFYWNGHAAFGLVITILAGMFAWESTMLVEEKRKRRNENTKQSNDLQ